MATKANHYIDNQEFLAKIIVYRDSVQAALAENTEKPRVPEYIGECFIKIANHLAHKSNFINYSYRDDMILDAIENCLIYVDNFDPKKSSNPFAYFTQISYYAFIRRIQKEKRQLSTKHKYIQSLDIDDIIRQAGDEGTYGEGFVSYLKQQADQAKLEMEQKEKDPPKPKRTPKYMKKKPVLFEDDTHINEADHIDHEIAGV